MEISKVRISEGTEDPRQTTPWESLVLAYAAMVPILAGAVACLVLHGDAAALTAHLTVIWSGAVLCFLSGVRRGLSFRQEGGPLLSQLATMLCLFILGTASLLSRFAVLSLVLQMLGYAFMALYDPVAAREGEVPRYFQRLRPLQMLIPIASLALVLLNLFWLGRGSLGLTWATSGLAACR
jgi:hypothetical protein